MGRKAFAQSFPYQISVETVSGHCYDDGHLIFTLLDNNGNEIQIDPQTHNAVNISQYPLYNVQFHYQNVASGLGVQYDYSNDIMLMQGTYDVGVRANIPAQDGGYVLVDTTLCGVLLTTSYQPMEASVLSNLALGTSDGIERYGYRPAFDCADIGRIQLQITQGAFPYEVSIFDEQQAMIRHAVFQHRVNNGNYSGYANYRDYYTFDSLAAGTYSILVSDSCGYSMSLLFTVPNAEPNKYYALVSTENLYHPNETLIPFQIERRYGTGYGGFPWFNYSMQYLDSILPYRFINPGNDTTEWKNMISPSSYSSSLGTVSYIYDTLSNYCIIFNDTVKVQIFDLCHDTLITFSFKFIPQFDLFDSIETVYLGDSIILDTCANYLLNGVSTQTYKIGGDIWTDAGKTIYGGTYYVSYIPFRYYRTPLSYDVWSLPDSTLLGHSESNEFTGLGTWVSFAVDTSVSVHISITDSLGCRLAEKDTVFVYQTAPLDSLLFWFEIHNDIDDIGWESCCSERYLWIQEHGVDANTFRRNMTLRLFESPLYNSLNFTAIRQEGVWNVSMDDPDNHSTYVEFSYEDGWRATVRDSVCLPPGRYKFEVTTDCGVDTITKEWAGYYYDSLAFTSSPQYEMQQVCDKVVVTQVSTGLENYVYYIDPSISNDSIIQENCGHALSCSSSGSIYSTTDPLTGHKVLTFTLPGTYYLTTYSYNYPPSYFHPYHDIMWCHPDDGNYVYAYDTITVAFSYLDFEMASALLCDSQSEEGIVTAQAINGNPPYTYTLYDQWGASGNVIATNSSGFFDNVPMVEGQHLSVSVTDSCSTSFSINITAALLTHGNLLWEQGSHAGIPHCVGDSVHLAALAFPPPASYQWSAPNGLSVTSQTNEIVLSNNEESGWYTVEILNSHCGASLSDSVYITVRNLLPKTDTIYLCENDSVTITAQHAPPFLWSTGDTTQSITVSSEGDYTVSLSDVYGCYYDSTVHVILIPIIVNQLSADFCDFFEWNDSIYTESSTCRDTLLGSFGCDSIFEIQFTIHHNPIVDAFLDDMAVGDTQTVVFGPSESSNLHYAASQFSLNDGETGFTGAWVDSIQESIFTISPPDSLLNDTTIVYTFTLTNELGCSYDTSISIHVYAHQYVDLYDTIVSSELPYNWNGMEFMHTGIQTVTIPTVHGADSVISMHLSVIYAYDTTVCDNFLPLSWRNQEFTHADMLTLSFAANGTDSIEVLSFQVNEVTYQTVNAVILENDLPYELNGESYDSTGTYSQTLENTAGCDSVLTINLLVVNNLTVQIDSSVCSNELPIVWNDSVFTQEEVKITVLTTTAGSDSVVVMNLTVREITDTTLHVTVLENDLPYHLNDSSYHGEGIYTQTLTNSVGCDSILTLELSVLYNISVSLDSTVCTNELPFTWNDSLFTEEGTKITIMPASSGVDSIVSMTLHTRPLPSAQISGTNFLCTDSSGTISVDNAVTYLWNSGDTTQSIMVNASGLYSVTVTDEYGCINSATHKIINLIVNPIETIQIPTLCAGGSDTILVGSNQGSHILIGQYDSIPLLSDEVIQSDNIFTASTEVASVEVDNPWAVNVGDTSFVISIPEDLPHDTTITCVIHLHNAFGCSYDTTITVIGYSHSQFEFDTTVCDSFTWNGVDYTASGQYTQTLVNEKGCDSVVTMNLTVFYSSVLNDTLVLVQNQLPYYFAPTDTTFGMNSASAFSFSYWRTGNQGCDTFCNQTVIVYQNTQHTEDTTVCASEMPFTWHGHIFTEAGSHTDTLLSANGSDSVCIYMLSVDLVTAAINSPTHIVCYGASTGAASATVTGGAVPLDYVWTNALGTTVSTTVQISNQPADFYTFSVTDQLGCSATDTVTLLTLNGELTPGSITDNQEVCEGDMLMDFSGTVASGGDNSTYQWQIYTDSADWDAAPGTNNGQNYSYPLPVSNSFALRRAWISQSCGTEYSNTVTVTVGFNTIDTIIAQVCQNTPYMEFGFDISAEETVEPGTYTFEKHYPVGICDSIIVLMLTVNATSFTELTMESCGSFSWNGITYYEPGNYEQTFENAAGCDSLVQLQLSLIDTGVEIVPLTEDFCEEMSAELSVITELADYVWNTGEEMPTITVTVPGTYSVTASQGDCRNSASYTINPCELHVSLPNAITPSRNDGHNDKFAIPTETQAIMHSFEIRIFNRWGEQIFYSTDKNFQWKGESKGKIFYNTVYTYIIRYTDANGKPYYVTGSVTVL